MKICKRCGLSKEKSCFYLANGTIDGLNSVCKKCKIIENSSRAKQWNNNNRDKCRSYCARWRSKNEKLIKEYQIKWYALNRNDQIKRVKKWIKDHHSEKKIIRAKEYLRIKSDPKKKLNLTISSSVRKSLKAGAKNGRHWEAMVGYTTDQLRRHLEKLFKPGMTWENHGSYWHIDHKIPIVAFNFKTASDIDFKRCWSLNNLQPLPATKNLKKNSRLDKPFQPSLILTQDRFLLR